MSKQDLEELYEDMASEIAYLFQVIHSCDEAIEMWHPDWAKCPICGAEINEEGYIMHREKGEITH